jgi:hypothetical protein
MGRAVGVVRLERSIVAEEPAQALRTGSGVRAERVASAPTWRGTAISALRLDTEPITAPAMSSGVTSGIGFMSKPDA